ncbi:hypothetical protein NDU88_004884 [Pleurodeles waltl]|uniref:Uncharacterized protein n=1 Tax=Pleurodeles waltl TaxID=8319 RepID=A0AAV7LJN7_PLEWA|nr:hypothetical protein NDU88_004884 [Pleurodeles waltl]
MLRRTAAGQTRNSSPWLQITSGPRPCRSVTLLQEQSRSAGVCSAARPQRQPGPIRRHRAEAVWRMVAGRHVTPGTDAEEGHRSKEEKPVPRLQDTIDLGME